MPQVLVIAIVLFFAIGLACKCGNVHTPQLPVTTIHDTIYISTDPNPTDYQVELEMDGAYIFDGDRYVGWIDADSTQAFTQLVIKDNQ